MPNKHASIKHLRQTKVRAAKNLAVKNQVKKLVKTSRKHLLAKEKDKATTSVRAAGKALDKAASNGVIRKNTAARLKSRLMKQLHALGK
ncbi:MAG: 30S ribosomal protein S20 [Patescibacteria group bacterium]|jgi:small subunit ribosomal protein S20